MQESKELRCNCGKLLAKAGITKGTVTIEIKCSRCQKVNRFKKGGNTDETDK